MNYELIEKKLNEVEVTYNKYICDWSKLSVPNKIIFIKYATDYGFDPYLGEMIVFMDKPYITHKGLYKKINESKRMLSKKDIDLTQLGENNYQAIVTMYIAPEGYTAIDFITELYSKCLFTKDEILDLMKITAIGESNEKINKGFKSKDGELTYLSNFAKDMAIKSAECKILRRALCLSMSAVEEMIDDTNNTNNLSLEVKESDIEEKTRIRKEIAKIMTNKKLNGHNLADYFLSKYNKSTNDANLLELAEFQSYLEKINEKERN